MASRRQRPLSANFVSVGNLRQSKEITTSANARTSPNKIKTPLMSSRSNLSQGSVDFGSEALSITGSGVGSTKSRERKEKGDSSRASSIALWKKSDSSRPSPKIVQREPRGQSVPNKSASVPKRSNNKTTAVSKPAWFVTTDGIPNETPRSDSSKATFNMIPQRPSIEDFINSENLQNSPHKQEFGRSLSNPDGREKQSAATSFLDQTDLRKIGDLLQDISSDKNYKVPNAKDILSSRGYYSAAKATQDEQKGQRLYPEKTGITGQRSAITGQRSHPQLNEFRSDASDTESVEITADKKSKIASVHRSWGSVEGIETKTDDYLIAMREKAAIVIQRWYKKARIRRTAGAAAMKRMMASKKQELETRMSYEREQAKTQHNSEMGKIKRREEKSRIARQAAIEELQKKREDKKVKDKDIAQQEIAYLQESGKISKQKSQARPRSRQKGPSSISSSKAGSSKPSPSGEKQDNNADTRPGTASSIGRKVNEIFEGSSLARSHRDIDTEVMLTDRTVEKDLAATSKPDSTVKSSKTTFEDLLDTLKELEADPPELKETRKSFKDAWGGDTIEKHSLTTKNLKTLTAEGEGRLTNNPLLTADKLRSIMDFLDEVEQAEQDIRSELSRSTVVESVVSEKLSNLFDETASPEKDMMMESASQVASDISNAIAAQKEELDDRKRSVNMLQKAIQQQRDFTSTHLQEVNKEHKQQLALQRQEYEGTIQRHLSFIDQLIDDKKVLSQRCEEVVKKLKETDQKYATKLKTLEENHAIELKKQKEIMEAAEKLRREKWIQEKSIQIKEMTVKGLEPDIQKLIAKHKAEIKKLKAMHQGELLEADERAGRKYIRQIEELRGQLENEKDLAVQRERDIARQRYEKQLEQEEQAYQQQRRRLYSEVQEEKERLADQIQRAKQETIQEKNANEDSYRQTLLTMQEEHHKKLDEIERRHTLETSNLKEQLEIEKQQWIENYMKKQDTYLLTKERELKDGVREARDKEIEMVISKLEKETAQAREECERAAENRIKRIRDKYENEMKELERSERSYQERYSEAKERANDLENEGIRLRSQLKLKDQEVVDVKKLTDQLQNERGKVTDIVRQEFADRLVTTEEDNKRLRNGMSETKARHRIELERVVKDKEDEMEEVHKRVKIAISKKEETVQLLRQQMQAASKRADHLEMLLSEQRKKLLP